MSPPKIIERTAEQVGDMVRDAFYEASRGMQMWNGTLGPMSEDEIFAAWMASESRKQLMDTFPALNDQTILILKAEKEDR